MCAPRSVSGLCLVVRCWFGGVPVVCREGMLYTVQWWCWRVTVCSEGPLPVSHERDVFQMIGSVAWHFVERFVYRVFLVYSVFLNINLVIW